ncbi:hypothetical protein INT45_000184 [Circinella minor]|uniref:Uncharacterized protein n=1 Tax=Circinella minor TaxID=1195481 RepID=A0A8H7VRB1_9FUNG|nr:hypothetical protein INT45_000184 [Circinella minor]
MSELRKYIIQSFCEDPLETLDVLAQTLRELNIYITHDDNEELGRQARSLIKVYLTYVRLVDSLSSYIDPKRNSSAIDNGVDDDSDNPPSPHPCNVGSNRS